MNSRGAEGTAPPLRQQVWCRSIEDREETLFVARAVFPARIWAVRAAKGAGFAVIRKTTDGLKTQPSALMHRLCGISENAPQQSPPATVA
jgi:hypothetical protein